MDCTIRVAKTKALICAFVFSYAKSRFSHDAAHIPSIIDFLNLFYVIIKLVIMKTCPIKCRPHYIKLLYSKIGFTDIYIFSYLCSKT